MGQEIQEMLRRSEVLGEQGDIDGSQAAATQAEAIKVGLILCCSDSLPDPSDHIGPLSTNGLLLQARRTVFEEEALETAKANVNRYGEQVCEQLGSNPLRATWDGAVAMLA